MIEGAREKNRRRIFVNRDDEELDESKLETMFEANGCGTDERHFESDEEHH